MDAKSLAKSKRAHSQHHKKHHPNQKVKGTTSSVGASSTDKALGKAVKEKPRQSKGPTALPSNWDRYEDEYDSMTENQIDGHSSQPSDVVVPKSKGADYAYLISEAKSQNSLRSSSEIFPSLDDFVTGFGQGKSSFFTFRGESILSSIQNDSFILEDKATASYEASFLSLDLRALSEQLAKVDLPKRLFMEADLFPPELYSEREQERQNSSQENDDVDRNEHEVASYGTTQSHYHAVQDHASRTALNPVVQPTPNSKPKSVAKPSENQSKFKAETAEAELDILLDSFADAKLTDSMGLKEKSSTSTSTSKKNAVAVDIDATLDDLLKETSTPALLDQNSKSPSHRVESAPLGLVSPPSHPTSKSELLDDFDSWLDTI